MEDNKVIIIVMEGGIIQNIVGNTENVTVKVLDHDKIEDLENIIEYYGKKTNEEIEELEAYEKEEVLITPEELKEQKQLIKDCDSLEEIEW